MHPLTAIISLHDGRNPSYGPDEDARRQIIDCSWGTQIPGGHGAGELTIPRVDLDPIDAPLLASVEFLGPGSEPVYEGRLASAPRFEDDRIVLELEGWVASLDDNLFRELYVTRDLSRWGPPSVERQLDLAPATLPSTPHSGDASVVPDETDGEALKLSVTGAWDPSTTAVPLCETWFDAGAGLVVARWGANWKSFANTNFELKRFEADDDSTPQNETDVYTATTGNIDRTPTTARRRIGLTWIHPAAGGTDGVEHAIFLTDIGVYGDHGLTLYATEDGGAMGVRGDEVLRDCLSRSCPLLNLEDIETSSFIIPELVFDGWDSRARAVVEQVTLLGGASEVPNDWGVYGRRFFWRSPGSYGTTHWVRFDDGVSVDGEGEDSTALGNAMIATFTDAAGQQKAYGYTGSGADFESDLLLDTDPLNPIAFSEVDIKVITQDVGRTSPEGALLLGQLALREAVQTTRTGSYKVPVLANGDAPYTIRAGDKLVVEDDQATEQYILQTQYQHSDGHLVATIGRPQPSLGVAIAQLAMANGGGWIGRPALRPPPPKPVGGLAR